MLIEAFGAPGVGKSYVCSRLLHVVGDRVQSEPYSLAPHKKFQRVFCKTSLMIAQFPVLICSGVNVYRLARQTCWSSYASAARALFNWFLVVAAVNYMDRNPRPILLSQGIFQAIWSLAYRAKADASFPLRQWVDLSLRALPERSLVVLTIVAPVDRVKQRLDRRGGGQSIMDANHNSYHMERAVMLCDQLQSVISEYVEAKKLRLVVFDNGAEKFPACGINKLIQALGLATEGPSRRSAQIA